MPSTSPSTTLAFFWRLSTPAKATQYLRERGRQCDLVQERLKQMEVAAVISVTSTGARRSDLAAYRPAEPTADNHNAVASRFRL